MARCWIFASSSYSATSSIVWYFFVKLLSLHTGNLFYSNSSVNYFVAMSRNSHQVATDGFVDQMQTMYGFWTQKVISHVNEVTATLTHIAHVRLCAKMWVRSTFHPKRSPYLPLCLILRCRPCCCFFVVAALPPEIIIFFAFQIRYTLDTHLHTYVYTNGGYRD